MTHLLGLDIGTSGAKAIVADAEGRLLAAATAEYPLSQPRPLWSEQDPADWWRGAREALRAAVAQSGVAPAQIAGLGLTGQMHGATFLDAADQVIRPAILWNDQRTAAACEEITARVGAERLIALTGNPALTGFQAPKIIWLRNEEPAHYARLARVLLPKDYIRLLLTGERATDASDAAGTLLLDLRARDYSDEVLGALEIPRAWLPRVYEGPEVTGRLRGGRSGHRGGAGRRAQQLDRHLRRTLRPQRRAGARPRRATARLLPRRPRRLPPDGRHPQRRRRLPVAAQHAPRRRARPRL
jgi:xylulokinase